MTSVVAAAAFTMDLSPVSLGAESTRLQKDMLEVLDPAMAHIKDVHEHLSEKIEPRFV
jgi:hypothetical protein